MKDSLAPRSPCLARAGQEPTPRRLLPPAPPGPRALVLLGDTIDWAIVAIGAIMVALVFLNVLLHLVNKDLAWLTELGELLMVWVTFLGGAAAARRGAHMAITEFIDQFGAKRRIADLLITAASALVLLLLAWYGGVITLAGWSNRLTVLDWPMSLQYLALPVGALATLVYVVWDGVQIARGKTRQERFGV